MAGRVVRAAGLIVFRRRTPNEPIEYLLLQTSYGIHHWTPPKGHVDPGENELQTALRETEEEAGLTLKDMDLIETFTVNDHYIAHGKPKQVTYWLAKSKQYDTEVRLSKEHQAFKWFRIKDACEIAGFSEMASVLQKADNFLQSK